MLGAAGIAAPIPTGTSFERLGPPPMRFDGDGHECAETAAPGCTTALIAGRPANGRVAPDKETCPFRTRELQGFSL